MECFSKKQAEFLGQIRELDRERYLDSLFVYSAAPVLRGAKPAVLVMINDDALDTWKSRNDALCQATGLCVRELGFSGNRLSVLIYERGLLQDALSGAKALAVLSCYGYPPECGSVNPFLEWLMLRFQEHGSEFPHEIGLFLGYPPEDVAAFIKHKGRNFLSCRYWKVYHDTNKAHEVFQRIEEASSYALEILTERLPVHTVASMLRTI